MNEIVGLSLRIEQQGADSADRALRGLERSSGRAESGLGGVERQSRRTSRSIDSMSGEMRAAQQATAALATASVALGASAYALISNVDSWTQYQNSLRRTTSTSAELAAVTAQVSAVAQQATQPLQVTGELYDKLRRSTQDLGVSQERVLNVTSLLSKGFAASGGAASTTAAAVLQLGQALDSGSLMGDEFRAVSENAPIVLEALQKQLGRTRAELRVLASQGGITSQILIDSIEGFADEIDTRFAQSVTTFATKMNVVNNNMMTFVGSNDSATGAVGAFGDTLVSVSDNLDTISGVVGMLAVAIGGRLTGALASSAAAFTRNRLSAAEDARQALASAQANHTAELQAQRRAAAEQIAARHILQRATVDARATAAAAAATSVQTRRTVSATATAFALDNLAQAEARAAAAATAMTAANGRAAASATALTAATSAASRSTAFLGAAMGVLGGPVGVIATVGLGLYAYREELFGVESATESLARINGDLTTSKGLVKDVTQQLAHATDAETAAIGRNIAARIQASALAINEKQSQLAQLEKTGATAEEKDAVTAEIVRIKSVRRELMGATQFKPVIQALIASTSSEIERLAAEAETAGEKWRKSIESQQQSSGMTGGRAALTHGLNAQYYFNRQNELNAEAERAEKELEYLQNRLKNAPDGPPVDRPLGNDRGRNFGGNTGGIDKSINKTASEIEQLSSQISRLASDAEQVQAFNASLGHTGAAAIDTTAELREYLTTLDLTSEAGRKAASHALDVSSQIGAVETAAEQAAKAQQDLNEQISGLGLASDAQRIQAFNDSLGRTGEAAIDTTAELREYLTTLDLTSDAGRKAATVALGLASQIGSIESAAQEATKAQRDLNEQIASGYVTELNAATDGFWANMASDADGAFESIEQGFESMLTRMLSQATTTPVTLAINAAIGDGMTENGTFNPLQMLGGNGFGNSLASTGIGVLSNAGQYSNGAYGLAGLGGGAFASISSTSNPMFGTLGSTLGMAMGGPFGATLGATLGAVAGSTLGALFGKGKVTGQTLDIGYAQGDASGTESTRTTKSALFGLIRSSNTSTSAIDAATDDAIDAMFDQYETAIEAAGDYLGVSVDSALAEFTASGSINLKGLDAEAAQAKLQAWIDKTGNEMIAAVLPNVGDLEGLQDIGNIAAARLAINSDLENIAAAQQSVADFASEYGANVTSLQGLRDYVDAQDLASDAGREAAAAALGLAGALSQLESEAQQWSDAASAIDAARAGVFAGSGAANAGAEFSELMRGVFAGDITKAGDLSSAAGDYAQQLRSQASSASEYAARMNALDAQLASAAAVANVFADDPGKALARQTDLAEQSLTELTSINARLAGSAKPSTSNDEQMAILAKRIDDMSGQLSGLLGKMVAAQAEHNTYAKKWDRDGLRLQA